MGSNSTCPGKPPSDRATAPRSAGFGKRVAAFALDYLIIAGYLVVLAALGLGATLAFGPLGGAGFRPPPMVLDAVAFLTTVLPTILYFALQEGSPAQATWGKRRMGLKVVDAQGRRLQASRAFLRAAVKFLPWQVAHTSLVHTPGWPLAVEAPTNAVVLGLVASQVLVVSYVIALGVGKSHRTPYDWVSGAFVVDIRCTSDPRT